MSVAARTGGWCGYAVLVALALDHAVALEHGSASDEEVGDRVPVRALGGVDRS